jgi:hypothetical protein
MNSNKLVLFSFYIYLKLNRILMVITFGFVVAAAADLKHEFNLFKNRVFFFLSLSLSFFFFSLNLFIFRYMINNKIDQKTNLFSIFQLNF